MLKKIINLMACAVFVFAASVYADEGTNTTEGNDQGSDNQEQVLLVNDEGQDQDSQDSDSQENDSQLLANDGEESESSETSEEAPEAIANDESTDETKSEGSEESQIAACGGGHCPAAMLEKLREEQKQQQSAEKQV